MKENKIKKGNKNMEITYDELIKVIENGKVDYNLIGTLVSGIKSPMYNGLYRIIGINHDGTKDTVDLMTEYCICKEAFGGSNEDYFSPFCNAKTCIDTFFKSLDDNVKEHMQGMKVSVFDSNHDTIYTKIGHVKLLSCTEIGTSIGLAIEGNVYPYFNCSDVSRRIKNFCNTTCDYWLRTAFFSRGTFVGFDGRVGNAHVRDTKGIVPVIRLGKYVSIDSDTKTDTETKDNEFCPFCDKDKIDNGTQYWYAHDIDLGLLGNYIISVTEWTGKLQIAFSNDEEDDGELLCTNIPIKYCPFCGRRTTKAKFNDGIDNMKLMKY